MAEPRSFLGRRGQFKGPDKKAAQNQEWARVARELPQVNEFFYSAANNTYWNPIVSNTATKDEVALIYLPPLQQDLILSELRFYNGATGANVIVEFAVYQYQRRPQRQFVQVPDTFVSYDLTTLTGLRTIALTRNNRLIAGQQYFLGSVWTGVASPLISMVNPSNTSLLQPALVLAASTLPKIIVHTLLTKDFAAATRPNALYMSAEGAAVI